MSKFVVPMWTARAAEVRRALRLASIPVTGDTREQAGELKAIVEADSVEDAVDRVRQEVGYNAVVPCAVPLDT